MKFTVSKIEHLRHQTNVELKGEGINSVYLYLPYNPDIRLNDVYELVKKDA